MNGSETDDATAHRSLRAAAIVGAAAAFGVLFVLLPDDDPTVGSDVAQASWPDPAMTRRPVASPLPTPPMTPPAVARTNEGGSPASESNDCETGVATEARSPELEAAQSARVEATMASVVDRLVRDADERARVTGLYLRNTLEVASPPASEYRAATERCGIDPSCVGAATQAWADATRQARAPNVEAIARVAAMSRDPFTYAVAVQACGLFGARPAASPSCGLLSLAQWARLDPDNATAWLHVAAEARSHKDEAAVDEAMHRVAAATNNRIYGNQLLGYTMARVPAGASFVQQGDVFMFVVGVAAAWQLPAYQTATQYCAAPLLQDSNRWQACDGLARNFVEHASTVLEKRIGFRLGERLKWPAEKLAALRDEDDAFARVQMAPFADPDVDSCRAFEHARRFWLQAASLGEVGAARALVQASGKSVRTLAAEERADRDARARTAAAKAAAPPASAASAA